MARRRPQVRLRGAARLSAGRRADRPTDDFATGEPGDEWWPRLQAQVLDPLLRGDPACFQRYDWHRRMLAEWHEVRAGPALLIEGVTSARREVAPALTMAVWMHAPRTVRLQRGLERDGQAAAERWNRWMAEEDAHFRSDDTIPRCEILADGAPTVPHPNDDGGKENPEVAAKRVEYLSGGVGGNDGSSMKPPRRVHKQLLAARSLAGATRRQATFALCSRQAQDST